VTPKFEIRKPKSETNPKETMTEKLATNPQIQNPRPKLRGLVSGQFLIRICFGFRLADFGFIE
jgi:hypothetical protein